jgi:hypothetical protein
MSRNSVRWLGIRANLKDSFVADWIEELAAVWDWIAFPHGEEFGLIHTSVVSGWVRIGSNSAPTDHAPGVRLIHGLLG